MKIYTRQEILDAIDEAKNDMNTFYASKIMNYSGKTRDGVYYTEIIAEWCLEHLELFDTIKSVDRILPYKSKTRDAKGTKSNRIEENIAMAMKRDKYIKDVGEILDYQVPIKKSSKIKERVGKIDLLSRDGDKLRILELKKPDSEETLLRCVLEGYTYSKRINIEKLKSEYVNDDYPKGTEVQIVSNPFVAYGSLQELEYLSDNRPMLHKLIEALDAYPLFYRSEDYVEEGMMKIRVIRGSNQIGGSIIEITSDHTKIILDAGTELNQKEKVIPDVKGLFNGIPEYDGVLVSHYHEDHIGLLNDVVSGIKIHMTKKMFDIIVKKSAKMNKDIKYNPNIIDKNNEKLDGSFHFYIGDIKVTPYLCDHSAYDSYMYLLETDNDSVLYTGDFRSNGRKDYADLLSRLPNHVNKLICEGTTITRGRDIIHKTEVEIEKKLFELMKVDKPVFVLAASTNIDRIIGVYNSSNRSNRVLAMDSYQADMLDVIGEVPCPKKCKDIKVVQLTNSDDEHKKVCEFVENKISRKHLEQMKFTMLVRTSSQMISFINGIKPEILEGAVLVYSMWNGYKKDGSTKKFIEFCKKKGMDVEEVHTSGHADYRTIKALIDKVTPNVLEPIHTEDAAGLRAMKKEYRGV